MNYSYKKLRSNVTKSGISSFAPLLLPENATEVCDNHSEKHQDIATIEII